MTASAVLNISNPSRSKGFPKNAHAAEDGAGSFVEHISPPKSPRMGQTNPHEWGNKSPFVGKTSPHIHLYIVFNQIQTGSDAECQNMTPIL
jgi:hypothetical protein